MGAFKTAWALEFIPQRGITYSIETQSSLFQSSTSYHLRRCDCCSPPRIFLYDLWLRCRKWDAMMTCGPCFICWLSLQLVSYRGEKPRTKSRCALNRMTSSLVVLQRVLQHVDDVCSFKHFYPPNRGYCFHFVCLSVCLSVRDALCGILCG